MALQTRINGTGNLEIKHPETDSWTLVVTLLRLAGGFDVKLIDSQMQTLNVIRQRVDGIGQIFTGIQSIDDKLANNLELLLDIGNSLENVEEIKHRLERLVSEDVLLETISLDANTEVAFTLPSPTKDLAFFVQRVANESFDLKYAFEPGQVLLSNGKKRTLLANNEYHKSGLFFTNKTLYLACDFPVNVEIEVYY